MSAFIKLIIDQHHVLDIMFLRSIFALTILLTLHKFKFWPSVQRVDDAFGDRNLICSCVSTEQFKSFENKQIVKT